MLAVRKLMMGGMGKPKLMEAYAGGWSGSYTSRSIPLSADIEIGELLVIVVAKIGLGSTAPTMSGWTTALNDGSNNPRTGIFWKIADAGDVGGAATVTLGSSSNNPNYAFMRFSRAAFDVAGSYATSSGTTPVVPSSISAAGGILVAMAAKNGVDAFIEASGMDLATSTVVSISLFVFVEDIPSGATGTRSLTSGLAAGSNVAALFSIKRS